MHNEKIDWSWELRATIVRSIILIFIGIVCQKYLGLSLLMSIVVMCCVTFVMVIENDYVNTWINNNIFGKYR